MTRPTHHIGDVAFDASMQLTLRAAATRAEAPAKYLGVSVETAFNNTCDARPFEHPSEAGRYTGAQMRAFLESRSVGARVHAYVERPPRVKGGPIEREAIIHHRLVDVGGGKLEWVKVEGGRDAR